MEISKLIQNQNLTISMTGEQLNEFANQILQGAKNIFEAKEQPEQYLTRNQTAEMLEVDLSTLWRYNKTGYLKTVEIGGKRRYKLSDINKILRRVTV